MCPSQSSGGKPTQQQLSPGAQRHITHSNVQHGLRDPESSELFPLLDPGCPNMLMHHLYCDLRSVVCRLIAGHKTCPNMHCAPPKRPILQRVASWQRPHFLPAEAFFQMSPVRQRD